MFSGDGHLMTLTSTPTAAGRGRAAGRRALGGPHVAHVAPYRLAVRQLHADALPDLRAVGRGHVSLWTNSDTLRPLPIKAPFFWRASLFPRGVSKPV